MDGATATRWQWQWTARWWRNGNNGYGDGRCNDSSNGARATATATTKITWKTRTPNFTYFSPPPIWRCPDQAQGAAATTYELCRGLGLGAVLPWHWYHQAAARIPWMTSFGTCLAFLQQRHDFGTVYVPIQIMRVWYNEKWHKKRYSILHSQNSVNSILWDLPCKFDITWFLVM